VHRHGNTEQAAGQRCTWVFHERTGASLPIRTSQAAEVSAAAHGLKPPLVDPGGRRRDEEPPRQEPAFSGRRRSKSVGHDATMAGDGCATAGAARAATHLAPGFCRRGNAFRRRPRRQGGRLDLDWRGPASGQLPDQLLRHNAHPTGAERTVPHAQHPGQQASRTQAAQAVQQPRLAVPRQAGSLSRRSFGPVDSGVVGDLHSRLPVAARRSTSERNDPSSQRPREPTALVAGRRWNGHFGLPPMHEQALALTLSRVAVDKGDAGGGCDVFNEEVERAVSGAAERPRLGIAAGRTCPSSLAVEAAVVALREVRPFGSAWIARRWAWAPQS